MTRCSNLCNLFATAVTSVLIRQSSSLTNAVTIDNEVDKTLKSVLLIQGLAPDLKDTVRSYCIDVLSDNEKGIKWFDAIPKKKATAMDRRLLNRDKSVPVILRYISVAHIWHSPLAYMAIRSGNSTDAAVASACSFAYWILTYVNTMHQQKQTDYTTIRQALQKMCLFLLDVKPMWYVEDQSKFEKSMTDTYQLLRNRKEIVLDEDEDENKKKGEKKQEDLSTVVDYTIKQLLKRFILSEVDTSKLIESVRSRSNDANLRAISFEYFSSLMSRAQNEEVLDSLTESIALILEQRNADGMVSKVYFNTGLEGSNPVYVNSIRDAFCSIIQSSMRRLNAIYNKTGTENAMEKMLNIIYSLALPYLPSDALLLQQSGLLKSLFHYWSFVNCLHSSRFTFTAKSVTNPVYIAGNLESSAPKDFYSYGTAPMWTVQSLSKPITQVAFVGGSLYALLLDGSVVRILSKEVKNVTPPNLQIQSIAGSAMGGHLVLISKSKTAYSTGLNSKYQCGRVSTTNSECTDLKEIVGASSGRQIVQAACGAEHTILLGSGEVFGCGSNSQSALGISSELAKSSVELKGLRSKEIAFVACGDHFSLFASKQKLYGAGSNQFGQLGMDPQNVPVAKEITEIRLPEKVQSERIAGIAAGSAHMVLWTQKGSLFVMGRNNCGQLGLGHRNDVHTLTEVVNMNVRTAACGGNATFLEYNNTIWAMGDNSSGNLGVQTPSTAVYPLLVFAPLQNTSKCIAVGRSASAVILSSSSDALLANTYTTNSLKMSYFVWLFTSMLFGYCSRDQLELSAFSQEFLRTVLREIYSVSQWVGDRCVKDEWDTVSPLSLREGSVGMITRVLNSLTESSKDPEANVTPFTYINQLLTILVLNARQSEGVVSVLREPSSLNVLLPLLLQLLNLHEMITVSAECQYFYLDNRPYTTPLLLCIHNLVSLLDLLLKRVSPHVVTECLTQNVSPSVLKNLAPKVDNPPTNSLFPYILLRQMGRVVIIPYGPNFTLIPAPYLSRLIASKCTELVWSLLESREWKECVTNSVFSLSNFVFNTSKIVQALSRQPVDLSVLDHLYYLVGPIVFYAGLQAVPSVDSPVAVTIATMRQEGRVIMFKDRKRDKQWEDSCLIKLNSSKELVWVPNNSELTLIKPQIPIDSYMMISRVFDNYNFILNVGSTSNVVEKSAVFSVIQEMVTFSIMELFQFPSIVSVISLSSIRSVMNHVNIQLPHQYSSASMEKLQERQLLVEGLWKIQMWNSIRRSLKVRDKVDTTVNVWPPSLAYGTRRCDVCSYPNPEKSRLCMLCGAATGTTLAELVAEEEKSEAQQQVDATPSSNETHETKEDSMHGNLESSCKWMFIENISNPSSASCSVQGNAVWDIITLKEQQKKVLKLGNKNYLSFENPFIGYGEGVYLNVWTIIMDVIVPDFSARAYTCLLQTDSNNGRPGSFFVRKDGSCGIGVYSKPNVIKNNCIHRIIISADLYHHTIRWYVDGAKQGELSPSTLPGAKILMDDRWSLDEKFLIGTECNPACVGTVMIFSLQLRRKLVNDREALQIAAMTIDGPPEPSNEDTINSLIQELKVPRSYCILALNAVGWSKESDCKQWIEKNKENVTQILISEAKGLEKMGYDSEMSKLLILYYGNRQQVLESVNPESKISNKNDPVTKRYLKLMESKPESQTTDSAAHHPGKFIHNMYTCCKQKGENAPGCTNGNGRSLGIIKKGDRVGRGPNWRWGNQNSGGFGTVEQICDWDVYPLKGVRVLWDNGNRGLYRWNLNDCFDLAIINEASTSSGLSLVSYYGSGSSEENPSFEIVDDIQAKFQDVQTKRSVRFPDISDCTLPEIRQELCTTSRALCSSYARVALLNLLSLTKDTSDDKISIYSLFMDSRENLFQSFLSTFIHDLQTSATDVVPQQVLKKEVSKLLRNEVGEASQIVEKNKDATVMNQKFHTMWNRSFSRRMYDTLLYEISLMASPPISMMQSTLFLQATSNYELIAKYPECGVSFWRPHYSQATPLATVLKCGDSSSLNYPPTECTYVVDLQRKDSKSAENFARPVRYTNVCTFVTTTGDKISVWRMVPPMNFAAFGMVVTNSADPPSLSDYVCIRRSLLDLGQAVPEKQANEMHVVPHTFWTSNSIIRHFFVSLNQEPPDSHLVFTLEGETLSDNDSMEQIGWMLDTFAHVVDNPSQSMGYLTPFVFQANIVTGLFASFRSASQTNRSLIMNYLTASIRQMNADAVTPQMLLIISDLNLTMDTLYNQQKERSMFSPAFQALIEVLVSVMLMCYDSRKKGLAEQASRVEEVMSREEYFVDIFEIAVIMESLCHRKTRILPLEYIMEPFLLEILVRLRKSQLLQSEHPYQDILHHQKVVFPGASRLTLRFDPDSCSEEDDVFAM